MKESPTCHCSCQELESTVADQSKVSLNEADPFAKHFSLSDGLSQDGSSPGSAGETAEA